MSFVFLFVLIPVTASAKNTPDNDRMAVIEKELNCFSSHAGEKGLDWSDVCYSAQDQEQEDLRDRLIAKAMAQQAAQNEHAPSEQTADTSYLRNTNTYEQYTQADPVQEEEQQPDDTKDIPRPVKNPSPPTDRWERIANQRRDHAEKHFGFGFESYNYNYKEPSLDVDLDGNGPFYGAYLDYSYRPASSDGLFDEVIDVYRAEASYSHGYTNYTGSGTINNEPNSVFEVRGLMGKDLALSDDSRITPYSGLGFRYLRNDSGNQTSSTGALGYDRESHYLYLPVGVEFATPVTSRWMLIPSAELDYLLIGWQVSHLTQAGYFQDVKNNQRNGYGIRGSVKIILKGDRLDYVVEPFIRHWYIGDSDLNNDGVFVWQEPRNKTAEYGVRLGAQF